MPHRAPAGPPRPWLSGIAVGALTSPRTVAEPPDHATTLALRSVPHRAPELVVMGPRTSALYADGVPGPSCALLRLRPGHARALLGRSLLGLADRAVPLRDLRDGLAPELADLAHGDPAGLTVGSLLAALDAARPVPDPLLADAAAMLAAGADVRGAARRLHVGERHLRTLFADGLGVAPKRFARIERVRTVLARAGEGQWRRLAAEAGYFDQSHMTGEFRRLMGTTLTDYTRGRLPAATACTGDPR